MITPSFAATAALDPAICNRTTYRRSMPNAKLAHPPDVRRRRRNDRPRSLGIYSYHIHRDKLVFGPALLNAAEPLGWRNAAPAVGRRGNPSDHVASIR